MDESHPTDAIAPWTIKAVAKTTRDAVTNAARVEGLTVGQWLEKRVSEWLADGGPVHVTGSPHDPDKMSTADLIEIARIAAQAKAAGQGGMNDAGQVAGRLLSERVRASAGLPPPVRRLPPARKTQAPDEG